VQAWHGQPPSKCCISANKNMSETTTWETHVYAATHAPVLGGLPALIRASRIFGL
jgi:hypothetical protein